MKELELRLALVCYGGASLAVYMNGVSAEILKLVRASKAFHSHQPPHDTIEDTKSIPIDELDSEAIYYQLLKTLSPHIKIRVIVDVISGASAGGINGIFLARALAHDLSFAPLRDMWLNLGDVEELMDKQTIATRWSKFYMRPIMWLFGNKYLKDTRTDREIRKKLSRFTRSRWFEPPFSGPRMLDWMLNACQGMGTSTSGNSLIPDGHKLDLFVSLTNFHGQQRSVELHDPPLITEPQHRLTLQFSSMSGSDNLLAQDLCDRNIAGLGFAARATSSFPGAFPPISLTDLDEQLAERGEAWPAKEQFLRKNFPVLRHDMPQLEAMSFIDGGVTNNKPFDAAIKAIHDRPAHREVDRRLIFVDPLPDADAWENTPAEQGKPGFFKTILASLAEIPRSEPIYQDLSEIADHNGLLHRQELMQEQINAQVREHLDNFIHFKDRDVIDVAKLASWREQAHEIVHKQAGIAYAPYMHGKLILLMESIAELVFDINSGHQIASKKHSLHHLEAWAKTENILCVSPACDTPSDHLMRVGFLRKTDVDFRIRRLRFVIKRMNKFILAQSEKQALKPAYIKSIKKSIYGQLETYKKCWNASAYELEFIQVEEKASLEQALSHFQKHMDLEEKDFNTDYTLRKLIADCPSRDLQHELVRAYVGFAFHDALTLPMTARQDILEQDQIKVDRISPQDCRQLLGQDFPAPLMGSQLYSFGAFFSRRARENDYLWGRLHAANRLLDFILNAASPVTSLSSDAIEKIRRDLFLSILDQEEKHMINSQDIIKGLKKKFSPPI